MRIVLMAVNLNRCYLNQSSMEESCWMSILWLSVSKTVNIVTWLLSSSERRLDDIIVSANSVD